MKLDLSVPDIERAVLPALRTFPRQRRDLAPYGIIWYAINKPIALLCKDGLAYQIKTYWVSMIVLALFSAVTGIYDQNWLSWYVYFGPLFGGIVCLNFLKAPWNCSILWLCLLGFISPFLLIVPILAKFPIGNRQVKWSQTRQALFWQKNPVYWGSLVVVWMAILIIRLPTHLLPFA